MCGLCAALNASRNWTDAAGQAAFAEYERPVSAREERERRVTILNHVLGFYGARVEDWGGSSYVLTGPCGKNANVYNLSGLWNALDELCGSPSIVDPLDPGLIERLTLIPPAQGHHVS
jgi:hypothetical protein